MTRIDILSKWFCKTVYRLTHSEKYSHNKNLWPYFKVERKPTGAIQNVYFKKAKLNNVELDVAERNKPLLIMASGPSVKHIDNTFFDDYFDYMGVNGSCAMEGVNFRWYVIIDRNFIIKRLDLVRKMVAQPDLILFCPCKCLESICSLIPWAHIRCQFKVIEVITQHHLQPFLGEKSPVLPNANGYHWAEGMGFSDDVQRAVFDYGTVAYPALQIACALGYKKIYLAGLDMTQFNAPRFYEQANDVLSTQLERNFDTIVKSFTVAKSYCDQNNIEVVNLSPQSAVESFQKLPWMHVAKAS